MSLNNNKVQIFLSGGIHGTWQDEVMKRLPGNVFFDPRSVRFDDMYTIARTEREWLDQCHILFFYFEADNPSGLGSAFEVGYCIATSRPVIFVDEKRTSHSEWLGVHCDRTVHSLEEGIQALRELITRVRYDSETGAADRR